MNALAAILTLQLMLPLYPQGKLYFDFVASQGFVSGWQWVRNTVCFMIGGAPWTKSGEPWEGYPEWLARYNENPVLFVTAAYSQSRSWRSAHVVCFDGDGRPQRL